MCFLSSPPLPTPKKTDWFKVRESQRVADSVCKRPVAGGHPAGELRGPAADAVWPLHCLRPAGPLRPDPAVGAEPSG